MSAAATGECKNVFFALYSSFLHLLFLHLSPSWNVSSGDRRVVCGVFFWFQKWRKIIIIILFFLGMIFFFHFWNHSTGEWFVVTWCVCVCERERACVCVCVCVMCVHLSIIAKKKIRKTIKYTRQASQQTFPLKKKNEKIIYTRQRSKHSLPSQKKENTKKNYLLAHQGSRAWALAFLGLVRMKLN